MFWNPGFSVPTPNLSNVHDEEIATEATVSESNNLLSGRYGEGKTAVVATVTSAGDTVVHTPVAESRIRVFWICAISDPSSATFPLIKVKLGSTEIYRSYAISHWEVFTGEVDAPLVVNLNLPIDVAFTAHILEVA